MLWLGLGGESIHQLPQKIENTISLALQFFYCNRAGIWLSKLSEQLLTLRYQVRIRREFKTYIWPPSVIKNSATDIPQSAFSSNNRKPEREKPLLIWFNVNFLLSIRSIKSIYLSHCLIRNWRLCVSRYAVSCSALIDLFSSWPGIITVNFEDLTYVIYTCQY